MFQGKIKAVNMLRRRRSETQFILEEGHVKKKKMRGGRREGKQNIMFLRGSTSTSNNNKDMEGIRNVESKNRCQYNT